MFLITESETSCTEIKLTLTALVKGTVRKIDNILKYYGKKFKLSLAKYMRVSSMVSIFFSIRSSIPLLEKI